MNFFWKYILCLIKRTYLCESILYELQMLEAKNVTSNFFSKMRSNIQFLKALWIFPGKRKKKKRQSICNSSSEYLSFYYAVIITLLLHCHQNRGQNNGLKIEAHPCNSNLGFNFTTVLFNLLKDLNSLK